MKWQHVCFEGFGYAVPPVVVSSAEIEQRLRPVYDRFGLHEGRLELMSGIRERRFWELGTLPSDGSALAGQYALAETGVSPGEIECLIHTSVSRDCLEPATASIVHHKLDLPPQAMIYDVSNACLGFLNGIISLANMIELGQVKKGLVVAGESSRQLVETTIQSLLASKDLTRNQLKDSLASLTIGSGAAALVMAHESVSRTGHKLLGGAVRTASEHNRLCRGSEDIGFTSDAAMLMITQSERLLEAGCSLVVKVWNGFMSALGWSTKWVDRAYCHQVGSAHRDRMYETIGLDMSKDFSTFQFLGNVGSASLPITMAMGNEAKPPTDGERIGMFGIGSGLSCVMLGVRW